MNASGCGRLPFAAKFSKQQGESNVYDGMKALGLAPGQVVTMLRIRT